MAAGDFKPVSEVLETMDNHQKAILFEKCKGIVDQLDWTDAVFAAQLIMADHMLTQSLCSVMSKHLSENLNMKITTID